MITRPAHRCPTHDVEACDRCMYANTSAGPVWIGQCAETAPHAGHLYPSDPDWQDHRACCPGIREGEAEPRNGVAPDCVRRHPHIGLCRDGDGFYLPGLDVGPPSTPCPWHGTAECRSCVYTIVGNGAEHRVAWVPETAAPTPLMHPLDALKRADTCPTAGCVLAREHDGFSCMARDGSLIPSEPPAAEHDTVAHPAHYTSSPATCSGCGKPIECIDVVQHMPFSLGSVVKYVWRHDLKGAPIEDLRKAIQYLEFEIARRERAVEAPQTFTAADIFPEQVQS